MPPLRLTSLLQTAFPHLTGDGRALISVLGCVNGRAPDSANLAEWLGFRDRYQLRRALRRQGLPPLGDLEGWARALYWLLEADATGASLRDLARRERLDPAIAYRLIRRVTGRRWSELRREGLEGTLARFRCHYHADTKAAGDGATNIAGRRGYPAPPLSRSIRSSVPFVERRPSPRRLSGVLSERIAIPGAPFDVALTADGTALVTRLHAAAVDVLRLDPPRLGPSIRVGPTPTRVICSRRGPWAYVTSQFAEAVEVIDLQRREQAAMIPVRGHSLGAALAPDEQTLYVTTNLDRLISISVGQRRVVGDAAIPYGCPQLVVHPGGRVVYVSCWRAGVIAEVEAVTLRPTRTFALGGIVQDVVVSPDGRFLYAANEAGWLDVVDLATGRSTARLELGTAALGLALSAEGDDLLVGLLYAGRVLVVDPFTLAVRAAVETGGRPRLMVMHPQGRLALLANEGGWVDVLR